MIYTVRVHPGPIMCGKCFQAMYAEDVPRDATQAVIRCLNLHCEQHDIPLVFPMPFTELQRVEDAAP